MKKLINPYTFIVYLVLLIWRIGYEISPFELTIHALILNSFVSKYVKYFMSKRNKEVSDTE